MKFRNRSYEKELLDGTGISFEDIRTNMQELDVINTWLGGHSITRKAMREFNFSKGRVHVCEIGCGGADNLRVIRDYGVAHDLEITCTGIDINPACLNYAKEKLPVGNFIHDDYKNIKFSEKPDIIFSSLFCHHFTEDELAEQLEWMKDNSTIGFFINDLHRHPMAYHSIRMLTALFSRSRLVRNDAPLSVLRGFTRSEWKDIINRAGINEVSIRWQWAFRWLITFHHV